MKKQKAGLPQAARPGQVGHNPPPGPHSKKHVPHHKKEAKGESETKGENEAKGVGKHLRRAYEHLGRVDALLGRSKPDAGLVKLVGEIRDLALEQLDAGADEHAVKAAAELTRAAEHVAFAALVAHQKSPMEWQGELQSAFRRQYEELHHDAGKAKDAGPEMGELLQRVLKEAKSALAGRNHARAIECMRGAEALAAAARHLRHAGKEA